MTTVSSTRSSPLLLPGILLLALSAGGAAARAEDGASTASGLLPSPLLALDLSAVQAFRSDAGRGEIGEMAAAAAAGQAPAGGAFNPMRKGKIGVRGGLGFSLDPETFLLAFEGDYSVLPNLAVGPLLQLGISDDTFFLAPSANAQWMFDLPVANLERLKPFLQGGLGFAYFEKNRPGRDDYGLGFLFNVGFGAEYYLQDRLSVGNNLLFNVLPDRTAGEHFFLTWQFLTVRYEF